MLSSGFLNFVAVLIHEALGSVQESLCWLTGPQVVQIALLIIFATYIIETMGELVTNHGAKRTVVQTERAVTVEEGRLQDAGGNCYKNKERLIRFDNFSGAQSRVLS